ncbi:sensor histidine kinase [Pedobacter steynii]
MGINEETTSLNDAVEKAKQQFLSNMSHEIRTPMNAVIGITNLLLQENPKPEQIESLKILKLSGENLLELINDVLDYSKLESGKMLVEPIDFNLIDLVNNVKETHHLTAKEKGLEFKIKIDSDLPVMVVGDPTRLAQILNNLVSNAIKFTNKGSVIMDLSLNRMVGNLVDIDFVVTDTGIGIETDKRDYIFESFTQGVQIQPRLLVERA